jgi:two-component system, NtrC family, sensor kinase
MIDRSAEIEEKLNALPADPDRNRERIDLLNSLGWDLRVDEDWHRVLELAQQARQLSEVCGYQRGIAGSLRNTAFAHYLLADLEAAIAESLESLRLFREIGDRKGEAQARAIVGFVYWTLGNYDQALTEAFQALRAAEEQDDKWGMGWCSTLIGGVYQSLRDFEQAVRYHQRSHELFAGGGDPLGEARSLIGIGAAQQAMGQTGKALECINRSLEIFRGLSNRMGESRALSDLGTIYQEQGRDDEALELHLRSLHIRDEDGNRQAATTSLLNLGCLYLKRGDRGKALDAARKALSIAEEIGAKPKAYHAHQLLSEIYERDGELASALQHERIFHRLREDVFNEEASTRLRNFQISLETERSRNEAEIHRLRNVELKAKNEELAQLLEELKATQTQLVQSEKMAALGKLVAALAHEINSPLGVIQSSFDLSQRCTDKLLEAIEVASSIDDLRRNEALVKSAAVLRDNQPVTTTAVERVIKIVQSLKGFARLDRAEYALLDLNSALGDVLTLLQPTLRPDIQVVANFGQIPKFYGYAAELNQVFMNLLQNAAQSIEGVGTIALATFADTADICIEFADTGKGIPPEQLNQLFDPRINAKGPRVKAAMGLFSCFHIVRQHGGTIRVASEPGKGTTFTVQLPIGKQPSG